MNKTLSRILWIAVGVLLVIAGAACMLNPGAVLTWMTVFLGVAMLVSGVIDIVIFAAGHKFMLGSGWMLLDGILTVVLSLFVLGNKAFTAMTLPFIFGMWLIFTGISKFASSFDLKYLGVRGWGWFTALGVLLTVVGFISFSTPIVSAVALSVTGGVILILEGTYYILRGCFSNRIWN